MAILLIIILLFAVLFLNYLRIRLKGENLGEKSDAPARGDFHEKLAELIRIPTVSWTDESKIDISALTAFQDKLKELFPLAHETMKREAPDPYGLIYRWPGTDTDAEPVLFLAHYDVVPAEEEGDEKWERPPFSGLIENGELWGRGSLDIKCQLALLMETAESLIAEGFVPQRTIYFAFGGDEEISGARGAQKIAARFAKQGLRFSMVMDEGGVIAADMLSFLRGKPVALLGLAEKGFISYKISAKRNSGHSSMPEADGTAVTHMARGVARISARRQPARLPKEIKGLLRSFVPHVSLPLGLVFANLWLTAPLVRLIFSKNKTTDSLIRSTQAFTVARSGEQENVIPGEAMCIVNHRIVPGDSMEALKDRHSKKLKGLNLEIEDVGNWPSNDPIIPDSDHDEGLELVKKALAESHPEAIIAPFLVNGSTDSKYYSGLTGRIIRFTPMVLSNGDIASIHSVNEKVSLENLDRGLIFYESLMKTL